MNTVCYHYVYLMKIIKNNIQFVNKMMMIEVILYIITLEISENKHVT